MEGRKEERWEIIVGTPIIIIHPVMHVLVFLSLWSMM